MAHSKRTLNTSKSIRNRSMLHVTEMSDDEKSARKKPSSSGKSKSKNSRRGSKVSSAEDESENKQFSSTAASTKDLLNQLADDFKPGDFDVVCSRGKWAMKAPGNLRYRTIIRESLLKYSQTANKQEKSAIVSEIVESIKRSSPQGGFVRCVDGTWFTVTDHIAREKTGQSFRDMLHHQYRSSTKAKRRRQKEKDLEHSHAMNNASTKKTAQIAGPAKLPAKGKVGKPSPKKKNGNGTGAQPKPSSGSKDEKPIPGTNAFKDRGSLPASALAIRSVATNDVFPAIQNPGNPGLSASTQEAGGLRSAPMPQIPLAFTSHGMNGMFMAHQQYLQNPYMHDQTFQMYPGGNNGNVSHPPQAQPFAFVPGQEERLDLEPIPIIESPSQGQQQRPPDPDARVDHASQVEEVHSLPHHLLLGARQEAVHQQQMSMNLSSDQSQYDQNQYQYFQPMMYQPPSQQFGAMSMLGPLNQPAQMGMGYYNAYGIGNHNAYGMGSMMEGTGYGDNEESSAPQKEKLDPAEGGG